MSERESPASALQRLAGELLCATSSAAIGALVATTAADLLGADAAAVFARAGATTLEALHTSGWPEEISRPFHRLELQPGGRCPTPCSTGKPVWLEGPEQWRTRYPEVADVGTSDARPGVPSVGDGDRVLGALVFSFLSRDRSPRTSGSTCWRWRPCAPGPRPRPAARRRAGARAREGNAAA